MNQSFDPEWAWSEYQPTADAPWNLRAAAHLYRRAGFGANRAELTAAVEAGAIAAADNLLSAVTEPEDYQNEVADLAHASMATGNVQQLSAWWAHRMLSTPAQLLEKVTLLWHGHFATSAQKVEDAELMFDQNNLLRKYALGDVAQLLQEISRDPAMLIYLDSVTNRKAHPNENYAREIMELFCLGEGNYTENDIRELARCFTGWEVKKKKFRFNRYQHDTQSKSVLGRTGKFGGEEGVKIVVEQDAAPQFIAMKLLKFLVMDEPSPSKELLAPLARELRENQMQIAPTVRRILTSNVFYSSHAKGRKVRSPVELAIGFLRSLQGTANSYELAQKLQTLGQGLLYPPSVKGWDGGRTWINSSTLLGRSNLIRSLLDHEKTRFGKTSLAEHLASEGAESADEIIDLFQTSLFAVDIPAAARDRIRTLFGNGDNRDEKLKDAVHALCTLPEFQLC
ncbi:MAG: DUF1800 domain-containing protein [Fuerstiella sp.]|nr:DUF1800 domain-containing protein [Fuerstiella sp.]